MLHKETYKETKLVVSRQYSKAGKLLGKEELQEQTLEVRNFLTEPARVSVDYGLTINLGNYESARIGVSVTVPCYTEEIDDAYAYAVEWATKRVAQEKSEIRQEQGQGIGGY